jgi:signal peptidase I
VSENAYGFDLPEAATARDHPAVTPYASTPPAPVVLPPAPLRPPTSPVSTGPWTGETSPPADEFASSVATLTRAADARTFDVPGPERRHDGGSNPAVVANAFAPIVPLEPRVATDAAPVEDVRNETDGDHDHRDVAVGPGAVRRTLGAMRAFVLAGLLGAVVAGVLVFVVSIPFGFRSLTIMSGSMVPTLGVGDVVMERQIAPLDLRVGDIVTFRDPTDQKTLITHRVRGFKVHDGTVDVVTKGDANNTVEKWSIPVSGHLGLVVLHLPKVGYALVWASGRTGRIALIAIPGVLLGIIELRRIWRPARSRS